MKDMGLPLGFLNVSPFEVDENKVVKTVLDTSGAVKKKRKKRKKKVIPPDYVLVRRNRNRYGRVGGGI